MGVGDEVARAAGHAVTGGEFPTGDWRHGIAALRESAAERFR